jgi:DNA mismatch repair protein MutL
MSKEDLVESFKPHTTSKLSKEEDLHAISSLGFRGEALSSIAAISEMTIQSKKSVAGYIARIHKGVLQSVEAIGMPQGTIITISHLFSNVPARKKFLKSEKTEFRHILECVSNFALAYPEIEFNLTHNGKEYFSFTKHHTLDRRIQTLLGDSLYSNLIPISFEESYMKVEGFIARPQYSIKGTSKLYTFVNKRRVFDQLIASATKDAYKNLLEYGSYPIALLYIKLPYEFVDVNVHPRKEQVSFIDQETIYQLLEKSISETLAHNNLTFFNVSWKDGGTKTHLGKLLKYELQKEIDTVEKNSPVQQFHNLYLMTETKNGVMIIDQHAAHEAILFRKLKVLYKKHKDKNIHYKLPTPILISLSLPDREILFENQELFLRLGFEFEEFDTSIRVNTVPELFKDRNLEDLIQEVIEDIRLGKPAKDTDTRTYRMLSYLACRTAIKGGTALSPDDAKKLVDDLQNQDFVYTCPHGRPVKIELSLSHIDRMFKRS